MMLTLITRIVLVLVVISLAACASQSEPLPVINEGVQRVPVSVLLQDGRYASGELVVTVFRPAGVGRHPLIVINHGRAGEPEGRRNLGRARFSAAAKFFNDAGFVVAVPVRLGYGVTGGPDLEYEGACRDRHFTPVLDYAALQIAQVIEALSQRPDVDASNVVVLGQSVGGASTVALAAQNPPGLRAAINFAGGAGGDPVASPGKSCRPERLQAAYADYGRTTRIPMLWVYTENDLYWGPQWPARWLDAYNKAGGRATFVRLGPDGANGHSLFAHSPQKWEPIVADFLRAQGFPMRK